MPLAGKVALITRAGSDPIGRGIATALAGQGVSVIVADLDERRGREVSDGLRTAGGHASFVRADLSRPQDASALLSTAERMYGGLDCLVNVLGGEQLDLSAQASAERAQANLLSALRCTVKTIEALRVRGGGSVLHIGSTSALGLGTHVSSPSRVATAAIPHLAARLAALGEVDIRVNCLAYGWLETPELRDFVGQLTPAQRLRAGIPTPLTPAQGIVELALQFLSDAALAGKVAFWAGGSEPVWLAGGRERPPFTVRASVPTTTTMGAPTLSDALPLREPLGPPEGPSPGFSRPSWAAVPRRPEP